MRYLTAEAVSPAHPDKVADQISDAILAACLAEDHKSRVAVECAIGHGTVHLVGEITKQTRPFTNYEYRRIVDSVLERCRYAGYEYDLTVAISQQSPDIARGVDAGGAGDQGIMVGYACRENEEMIPQELFIARRILRGLWESDPKCRDAKCQVTLQAADLLPSTVVVSAERMHAAQIAQSVKGILRGLKVGGAIDLIVNPAGDWTGGMDADAGVTGRKIVQDAYGPRIPVGGGAYSGKDATKVDRSAAYMARHAALWMLERFEHAKEAKVTVAYAIGKSEPIGLTFELDGKEVRAVDMGLEARRFEPSLIIQDLGLTAVGVVDYADAAAWGAYGRPNFPWER